jgi:hypothetical protein
MFNSAGCDYAWGNYEWGVTTITVRREAEHQRLSLFVGRKLLFAK